MKYRCNGCGSLRNTRECDICLSADLRHEPSACDGEEGTRTAQTSEPCGFKLFVVFFMGFLMGLFLALCVMVK